MSKEDNSNDKGITRRGFMKNTAMAGAGVMLAGSGILGGTKTAMAASSGDAVVDEIYRQAMDFHLHCAPDVIERKYDDFGLAKLCMDTGLTGFMLKSHLTCTAERVYHLRKQFPKLETFGAMAMNRTWGGMNVKAVEIMSKVKGNYLRQVYFPTQDAQNDEKTKNGEFVKVFDDGVLTKATLDVIKFCAKNNLIVSTGHMSTEEGFHIAEVARELKCERVVCTHVTNRSTEMSVENQKKMAAMGVYLEYNYLQINYYKQDPKSPKGQSPEKIAKWIKQVGADHIIFATDFGQVDNPTTPEGMRLLIAEMLKQGISKEDLIKMTSTNPYKILRV